MAPFPAPGSGRSSSRRSARVPPQLPGYITGRAIIAATARHVAIVHRWARVDISLDAGFRPTVLCEALRRGIREFAVLSGEEEAVLTGSLASAGLLSSSPPQQVRVRGTTPLAQALPGHGDLACPGLIYTADEAFWAGADPGLARLAFRVFVSRPASIDRCAVYAPLAAGRDVCMAGDEPAAPLLERALDVAGGTREPCVIDLESGCVTGRAASVRDLWTDRGGRLGITASRHERAWTAASGRALTWVSGHTAFPNLAVLPALEDTAAVASLDYPRVTGVDEDPALALAKCQAEGAERFAAGDIHPEALHYRAASELDGRWLDPRAIICYSPAQRRRLGLAEFDPDDPGWWVRGQSPGGAIWIPAALVFYPFIRLPWLAGSAVSSSGMAAYVTADGAIRRAWLELVERDMFQRVRFTGPRHPPARIRRGTLPDRPREIVEHIAEHAAPDVLILESPAGPPVALVRAASAGSHAIGMAAADSRADAIRKAASEALTQILSPFTHPVAAEAVSTPGDHAALYSSPAWQGRLAWMSEGPLTDFREASPGKPAQPGPRACWYELPSGAPGLHVVRVLDPGLIPLTFGYDSDPAGRSDLRGLLRMSGLDDSGPLEPHPFA